MCVLAGAWRAYECIIRAVSLFSVKINIQFLLMSNGVSSLQLSGVGTCTYKYYRRIRLICFDGTMGARREGKGALSLEFEKDDVICCCPTKYPKLFAAPTALTIDTLYSKLKRLKTQQLLFAPSARRKKVNFLKRWWFCPMWENFCGRPWMVRAI